MGLTEETDSQSPAALVGKQSPWSLKMWGCPTLPRRTWGLPCWLQELKEETDSPSRALGPCPGPGGSWHGSREGAPSGFSKGGPGAQEDLVQNLDPPPPPPPRASWA